MIDLIHIGDYKTGTTWWQSRLLPNHPEIYYTDDPFKHPEIVRLRHLLVDSRDLDFDAEGLREDFKKAIGNIQLGDKRSVMCCETLSGLYPGGENARRTAERLRAVFGRTKVVIVIREQLSMLKAIYSQYVKIGGTLGFEEFVFDPIGSPGLMERLKYHKIIDAYVGLFGGDNVYVGLFEAFQSNNDVFANDVLRFLGCSTTWQSGERSGIVNPSLTKIGLEIQRFVNRFLRNDFNPGKPFVPLDRIVAPFLSANRKKKLLREAGNRLIYAFNGKENAFLLRYAINYSITEHIARLCERIQIGGKLTIPISVQNGLESEFVASNRILSDKYKLPVSKYGWKM